MMPRTTLILALMLAAVAGRVGDAAETVNPATGPRPVVSLIAGESTATARNYVGTVSARVESDLGFPVSGTIASRPVNAGDTVRRNDLLGQLDPESLEAGVWAARAGVVVARQQLASASDALEREQTLVKRGVESRSRLQDADRAHAAARARLAQAQAALARAKDLLGSATLHAPFDGVITSVMAEVGAAVSSGQAVVRLAGTREREVVIDLGEAELAALPQDAEFEARLQAMPDTGAKIRLQSVDPVADRRTRTRRAHFALVDPPAQFRIGALVRVVPSRDGARVILIPEAAVLRGKTGPYVWRVSRPDGKVHRTPVTLGPKLGNLVVVSAGISRGQEVIIKGIHAIRDGQIVGPHVHL